MGARTSLRLQNIPRHRTPRYDAHYLSASAAAVRSCLVGVADHTHCNKNKKAYNTTPAHKDGTHRACHTAALAMNQHLLLAMRCVQLLHAPKTNDV